MGIIDRLFRRQRKSLSYSEFMEFLAQDASWTPLTYLTQAKNGYILNPYVYRSVNYISRSAAIVPILLYQGDQEVERHPVLDLLARPNPMQAKARFFDGLFSHLYLAGSAYLYVVRSGSGPLELYLLRPDLVEVKLNAAGTAPERYVYRTAKGERTFGIDEVRGLHFWHPLSDTSGLAPIAPASRSVDQSNASRQWNTALLQNSAKPSLALLLEEKITPEVADRWREQWDHDYGGPSRAGRLAIFWGKIKALEKIGFSPQDMDWTEGQNIAAREIAMAFGVPPQLLGIPGTQTFANYEQARKSFYHETVLPLLSWILDELNAWLVPMYGEEGLRLVYDEDRIPALQEERDKVWTRALDGVSRGVLTPNEARELLGYDPVPGADALMVPATMMPFATAKSAGGAPEKKATLTAEEQKRALWLGIEQKRAGFYDAVAKRVESRFNAEARAVAEAVRKAGAPGQAESAVADALEAERSKWEKLYAAIYLSVAQEFAQGLQDEIKALGLPERKVSDEPWLDYVLEYLTSEGGKRIAGILETTRTLVTKALAEGVAEGEDASRLARRVKTAYESFGKTRAVRIARTEVITASNAGRVAMAQAMGLPMVKTWLATRDDRVRDDHLEADGQEAPLDGAFDVGGYKLQFPGDASLGAPPSETVNCRCTVTFRVAVEGLQ